MVRPWAVLAGVALAGAALAAEAAPPALDDPMVALVRAVGHVRQVVGARPEAAHHVALAITESKRVTLQGTNGAWAGEERGLRRVGDVDLRVGTPQLDHTHKLRDSAGWSEPDRPSVAAPLVSGPALVDMFVRAADDAYRGARRRLIQVRANATVKVEREDTSDDWAPATPVVADAPAAPLALDEAAWREIVVEASRVFLDYPDIADSAVQISTSEDHRWLADADGTRIHDGRAQLRVAAWANTTAPDGMSLQVYDYIDVAEVAHLPTRGEVSAMARRVAESVIALRKAPLIDPYAGPAILRGRAAGVFFHEIFGHRVEGHRQKDEDEGQTFTKRVGQSVLPRFLSVWDDPTLRELAGHDLNGHYRWDDEGVPAERVSLVNHGILENFLMSRSPVAGFSKSNGHGRRQAGLAPVSRQGNLIVEAHQTVTYAKLREMLIAEVKKQGKPWGLVFDDISGGFTFTGRSEPNAFVVQPVTVWRVYADGRPDELVRGVDMIGTPLTTFARIAAAADDRDVFNGVCGAESGWVPVSASAPSLLVTEVEVQRREKGNDRPPVLPAPQGGER